MTIQEKMYTAFREAGMTHEGACATLAQIHHESRFQSTNAEDSKGVNDDTYTREVDNGIRSRFSFVHDGIGYGYAQWTFYDRKGQMYDYHRAARKSIGDSDTQISFLLWEMKNAFPNQWRLVTTSHDLEECSRQLLYKWENPDGKEQAEPIRYRTALAFDQQFRNYDMGKANMMTTQEAINKVISLACSEIGYHEKASNSNLDDKTANSGSGNWTKYARDLDRLGNFYNGGKNGYAWCDVFYDYLFVKSFGAEIGRQMLCQPTGSAGAGCLYSAQYYKNAGRWYSSPQPGDQIFFTYNPGEYSHTGLVEAVDGGTVTTIEGNTSDQVARKTYRIGDSIIAGYGRPKWELAANAATDGSESVSIGTNQNGNRVLKVGCRGEDVRELQNQLQTLGYGIGSCGADGDFGADTKAAVSAFQNDHNLYADGEVGDVTREAIQKLLNSGSVIFDNGSTEEKPKDTAANSSEEESYAKAPLPKLQIRKLQSGMEGFDVKLAQSALQCWGYVTIVSGIFGNELHEKIRDFQKNKGLPVTGIINTETWKKLLEI